MWAWKIEIVVVEYHEKTANGGILAGMCRLRTPVQAITIGVEMAPGMLEWWYRYGGKGDLATGGVRIGKM